MRRSGFTLIELLMASVILAILATIAVPNFTRMQMRAGEADVKSVAHMLQMAVEDYKATPGQEGMKPNAAQLIAIVVPSYLPSNVRTKRNPFNIAGQTYGTGGIVTAAPGNIGEVGYQFQDQVTQYTITCWGGNVGVTILTLIEGQ